MKFVELGLHVRTLREARTGRRKSAAMRVLEVWQAALDCPTNGIIEIYYNEARLPSPLLGTFTRMHRPEAGDIADIYVHKPHPHSHKRRLASHWKEFVIIKELMHCWSPAATYVGTPEAAEELLTTLNTPQGPFGALAIADYMAMLAAAEVIMPCAQIRSEMALGKDFAQIAHEQGLHPDVMNYICQHHMLEARENGSL